MGPKSNNASVDRMLGDFIDTAMTDPGERAALEREGASYSESVNRLVVFEDGTEHQD
jgi:hypothetical protein